MKVFSNLSILSAPYPALQHDPHKAEDVGYKREDHARRCATIWLHSRPMVGGNRPKDATAAVRNGNLTDQ